MGALANLFGYGTPARLRPEWYAGYLTFQNGDPRQRRGSLTGGGFEYRKDARGTFLPVVVLQTSATQSLTGGGLMPANLPALLALMSNPSGANSGS